MSTLATPAANAAQKASGTPRTEHFNVLIVGAGISGVGGAYHLARQCPDKSFVVLESQDGFGGTWRTHKYPGIRSDSDLYTFGYRFKPWMGKPIATAEEILSYMGEVIDENGLAQHIRYRHSIESVSWSSEDRMWTIEARATTPARRSGSPPTSSGCARATTGTPRATRRSGRAWTATRASSCIRRPGPKTWISPASAWS